jgi:DNA-binding NarL/FixJ family response regulator
MIDVLLAVPHPILAMGLQELLQSEADIRVVASADTKERALELFEELQPKVLVWDLDDIDSYLSPDLDLLTRFIAANPQVAILVIVGLPLSYYDDLLFQVGVAGYLPKEEVSAQLIETIKAIAASEQE